jgi:glyoxylase-like metal-dependent hydrolase (beta-lactamase superfamily II)
MPTTSLNDDLVLIDTLHAQMPEAVGVFLLRGRRPALIESGATSRLETLLQGVREAGVDPQDLQALAVTHIHLDHAGAAGALVRAIPHLTVYVHPVGAPHLIDPTRLVASASRLYGNDLPRLFGEIVPVPSERVQILHDGDVVELGSRRLIAVDTPGHARHHHAYWDPQARDLFTGDVAGVALPGSRYVRAPTPPPEIDIPAWHASLARLRMLRPRRLLLTHFGAHKWVEELLNQLDARLDVAVELVRVALAEGLDEEAIIKQTTSDLRHDVEAFDGARVSARDEVITPTRLNVKGLIRYLTSQSTQADRPIRR